MDNVKKIQDRRGRGGGFHDAEDQDLVVSFEMYSKTIGFVRALASFGEFFSFPLHEHPGDLAKVARFFRVGAKMEGRGG